MGILRRSTGIALALVAFTHVYAVEVFWDHGNGSKEKITWSSSHRMNQAEGKKWFYTVLGTKNQTKSCQITFDSFEEQKAFLDQLNDGKNKLFYCTGPGGAYVTATNYGLRYSY